MAHAKESDLKDLTPLFEKIRALELKEKSFGCFYRKSKGVLHFHISAGRRFAHVFDGTNWVEIDLPAKASQKQQQQIYLRISQLLL